MTKAANLASLGSVVTVPTGDAPSYQCRAWVNFNGTGTVAINASGNVSSITDLSTGQYRVNLTTALPDSAYVVSGGCGTPASNNNGFSADYTTTRTTSSFGVGSYNYGTWVDSQYFSVAVHR